MSIARWRSLLDRFHGGHNLSETPMFTFNRNSILALGTAALLGATAFGVPSSASARGFGGFGGGGHSFGGGGFASHSFSGGGFANRGVSSSFANHSFGTRSFAPPRFPPPPIPSNTSL